MTTMYVTGDTSPTLAGTVTTGTAPVSLVGAALELHLRAPGGATTIRTATILDAAAGTWSYTWAADELAAGGVGLWAIEVQVTYASGAIQTFPTERPLAFGVRAQVA